MFGACLFESLTLCLLLSLFPSLPLFFPSLLIQQIKTLCEAILKLINLGHSVSDACICSLGRGSLVSWISLFRSSSTLITSGITINRKYSCCHFQYWYIEETLVSTTCLRRLTQMFGVNRYCVAYIYVPQGTLICNYERLLVWNFAMLKLITARV